MATIAAYLISLSIIGFGLWIFAVGEAQPASVLAGIVIGLVPMAVGLASVANEIHNDLYS
jgi:ribose/xylose/arabinose/galactoside ABC-type transport system permease subunit